MMLLVPAQSFAGIGLLHCDARNGVWNAPSFGEQSQQDHNPLQGVVATAMRYPTHADAHAKDVVGEAKFKGPMASTQPASDYRHNHHAHKHPCCDGTPAVRPAVNTIVTSTIAPLPIGMALATLASIFLERPKRPPRVLIV